MNNNEMIEKNKLAEDLLNQAIAGAVSIKGNPMDLLYSATKRKEAANVLSLAFEAVSYKNAIVDELLSRELARECLA
jgi:hypothetical protein